MGKKITLQKNMPRPVEIPHCPFCDCADCEIVTATGTLTTGKTYIKDIFVECRHCKAAGPSGDTEEEAVRQWAVCGRN